MAWRAFAPENEAPPAMKIANCPVCSRQFKFRPNRKYCSEKCRYEAWRIGQNAKPCYYCGVPADGIDHVPPRSVRSILIQEQNRRWPFVEVNCCHECNSILGARPPWTLPERKAKVKIALRRRYGRVLHMPDWTEAQIAEYEERSLLGAYIRESVLIARIARQRIEW